MRNFILGVMVGTLLTTIGVQAAGKEGMGNGGRPPHLNDEHERQFQLQLEHIRKQTESGNRLNSNRRGCKDVRIPVKEPLNDLTQAVQTCHPWEFGIQQFTSNLLRHLTT